MEPQGEYVAHVAPCIGCRVVCAHLTVPVGASGVVALKAGEQTFDPTATAKPSTGGGDGSDNDSDNASVDSDPGLMSQEQCRDLSQRILTEQSSCQAFLDYLDNVTYRVHPSPINHRLHRSYWYYVVT